MTGTHAGSGLDNCSGLEPLLISDHETAVPGVFRSRGQDMGLPWRDSVWKPQLSWAPRGSPDEHRRLV